MMNELISFFVGIGVVAGISFWKPEKMIEVFLRFLHTKISKNQANKISNALGVKMIEVGVYTITFDSEDDKEIIKEGVQKVKSGLSILEEQILMNKRFEVK